MRSSAVLARLAAVLLGLAAISVAAVIAPIIIQLTLASRWGEEIHFLTIVGQDLEQCARSNECPQFSSEASFSAWCNGLQRLALPAGKEYKRHCLSGTVPMPLLSQASLPDKAGGYDQVLAFIKNRYPEIIRSHYPSECQSTIYILGSNNFAIKPSPRSVALSPGERDIEEFLDLADVLWNSAACRDKARFDEARSSFKSSDVFQGTIPVYARRQVRLSGHQLDALASLLAKDVFGEKPAQPAAKASH